MALDDGGQVIGRVSELWRYPVKSMQGEPVDRAEVGQRGLVGDRALALQDVDTGRIASAKSPRLWPDLLEMRASFATEPQPGQPLPAVLISLPGGGEVRTDQPDAEAALSDATGRRVRLVTSNPAGARYEQYVPPVDGADPDGADFYRDLSNDTFGTGSLHDASPFHLLASSTLEGLGRRHPGSLFDARRFRPNAVVGTDAGEDFVENGWVGSRLRLGGVVVRATLPMPRCVMVTRPQGDLPHDLGVLSALADRNRVPILDSPARYPCLGVAALVPTPGTVRVGDAVTLLG